MSPAMDLDLTDAGSWHAPIRDWLDGLRRSYLRSLDAADAAGAPEHVTAMRPIVERYLPCRITAYPDVDPPLVELRLDGAPSRFSIGRVEEIREIAEQAADESVLLLAKQDEGLIWLAIRSADELSRSAYHLHSAIEDILRLRAMDVVDERRSAQQRVYQAQGFHATPTPEPSGQPDPRWSFFVRITSSGATPVTLEHLRSQLVETHVIRSAPPDLESIMAQARLLFLFGWERWEFYAIAEQQATFALERSVVGLYDQWLERTRPRLHGQRSGMDVEIDAGPRRDSVLRVARRRGIDRPQADGRPVPRSMASVVDALVDLGFLTAWEAARAKGLIGMRNEFAHPPFAQLHLDTWAIEVLSQCAALINAMWHRIGQSSPSG